MQLSIEIPGGEYWDERKCEFISASSCRLTLVHSLVSISKWEAKYHKPFLTKEPKSAEEILDYIKFMTITQNVPDSAYDRLTQDNFNSINKYIENPMTATTINYRGGKRNTEVITSELIYYWMVAHGIPFECQKWHLNRLLMLIQVCNVKNAPPKKMRKGDILRSNAALNAARRAKYNSKG